MATHIRVLLRNVSFSSHTFFPVRSQHPLVRSGLSSCRVLIDTSHAPTHCVSPACSAPRVQSLWSPLGALASSRHSAEGLNLGVSRSRALGVPVPFSVSRQGGGLPPASFLHPLNSCAFTYVALTASIQLSFLRLAGFADYSWQAKFSPPSPACRSQR